MWVARVYGRTQTLSSRHKETAGGKKKRKTATNSLPDLSYGLKSDEADWRISCTSARLGRAQWIAPSADRGGRAAAFQVQFIWQKFQRPASRERKQTLICFPASGSQRASQRPPGGCPATPAPRTRMFGLENDFATPSALLSNCPKGNYLVSFPLKENQRP